jgi:hypothetical protein
VVVVFPLLPRLASRLVLLIVLPLGSACAAGSDDGLTGFSGPYTAGPAGESGDESTDGDDGTTHGGAEGPITTVGSADDTGEASDDGPGNPLCCQLGPQAGCDSMVTEACVCTSQPSCCQDVWSQECVDLASACGDPFCSDAPGTDDGTDTGDGLDCDAAFEFAPANPAPGVPVNVTFSDPMGLTWVGMRAEGPTGTLLGGNEVISGSGPFSWSYDYDGLAAGVWTFVFTHRDTENGPDLVRGSCQKQI